MICKLLIHTLHVQNHFTKMIEKVVDNVSSAGVLLEGVSGPVTGLAAAAASTVAAVLYLALSSRHLVNSQVHCILVLHLFPSSATVFSPGPASSQMAMQDK